VVDTRPAARIQDVLDLFDELARIARMSEGLFAGIEQVTGLRVGQVQLLRSVAGGAVEARELARRVGQTDEATTATIDGLVRHGLLHRERRPVKPERLRLTGKGTALLEQTQGVQVRLLDTLIGEAGADGVQAFRTTLNGIADVLGTIASRAVAG
jgi:DNA-binding MarR family transcriptional regulator